MLSAWGAPPAVPERPPPPLVIASAVLLVNSAYLAAFATPSLFYFANVALHVVLGVAVAVAAAV